LRCRRQRKRGKRKLSALAAWPLFSRPLQLAEMKSEIHPEYVVAHVRCTCGNEFVTRSTKPELHVEICSNCHPFYTGRQKLIDTGGRVERFQRRAARSASRRATATK
jgi:large subunit ribosomal protein L31